jgi:hypothetical protein
MWLSVGLTLRKGRLTFAIPYPNDHEILTFFPFLMLPG